MLHINRRRALAGLAATALSSHAVAQPSSFTTNMYGGRWENTWREKVLPPFAKTIGRSVTLHIGLGARWVANFRAAGKDNPPFSALMLNERFTAMLRDDGYFETLTPALVPNLADVVLSSEPTPKGLHARWRSLGVGDLFVSERMVGCSVLDLSRRRDEVMGSIVAAAKGCVTDGADVLVLGCLGMGFLPGLTDLLQREAGVPVVNPVIAALKIAEAAISLGLRSGGALH